MSMPLFSRRPQGVFFLGNDFIFKFNISRLSEAAGRSGKSSDRTDLIAPGPNGAIKKMHLGRTERPEHLKTKISVGATVLLQCKNFIAFFCFPGWPEKAFYI